MQLRTAIPAGLVIVFAAASSFAQTPVSMGIKAGMTLSSFTQDGTGGAYRNGLSGTSGRRTGWAVGASVRVRLTDRLDLQPEFYYGKRGGEDGTFIHDLSYIEGPILVNYHVAETGSARVFVVAGPSIGVRARAKLERPGSPVLDYQKVFVAGEIGVVGGVGVEVMGFSIEGRFTEGLSDLITTAGHAAGQMGPGKARNRAMTVLVGYSWKVQ